MTPETKEKLAGRVVVASVSGGKDSVALSLWLTEQDIEHERIFLDTRWEADLLAFGGINDGGMRWGMCETSPSDKEKA